jgi:MarR family transcriptional regulator, transcriptional regulator for hemolysin
MLRPGDLQLIDKGSIRAYVFSERPWDKLPMEILTTPGHLVSLAARGFTRLSEARVRPLGLGVGQVPVLVALQERRADTQRDLARFARVGQPPMAQMLARMERDGLIERRPDPDDRRCQRVFPTDLARSRLPGGCEAVLQGNRDALAGFSEAERSQLVDLLTRLIANLDRITGDAADNPSVAAHDIPGTD